jgi:hypothetical protein
MYLAVTTQQHDATYYRLKIVVVRCNYYSHTLRVVTSVFCTFIDFITIYEM